MHLFSSQIFSVRPARVIIYGFIVMFMLAFNLLFASESKAATKINTYEATSHQALSIAGTELNQATYIRVAIDKDGPSTLKFNRPPTAQETPTSIINNWGTDNIAVTDPRLVGAIVKSITAYRPGQGNTATAIQITMSALVVPTQVTSPAPGEIQIDGAGLGTTYQYLWVRVDGTWVRFSKSTAAYLNPSSTTVLSWSDNQIRIRDLSLLAGGVATDVRVNLNPNDPNAAQNTSVVLPNMYIQARLDNLTSPGAGLLDINGLGLQNVQSLVAYNAAGQGTAITLNNAGNRTGLLGRFNVDLANKDIVRIDTIYGGSVVGSVTGAASLGPVINIQGGSSAYQDVPAVEVTWSVLTPGNGQRTPTKYEYRVAVDGGQFGAPIEGNSVIITDEGERVIQARVCDLAHCSDWTQVSSASTVRINRSTPEIDSVEGLGVSGLGFQYRDGDTYWYNSNQNGSLRFTVAVTIPSGFSHIEFPALTTGWSAGANVPNNPGSHTYTWAQGAAEPGATTFKAYGISGRQDDIAVDILDDPTAPANGSLQYTNGYIQAGPVTLTTDRGTDVGSGIDGEESFLARRVGDLTNGTCVNWTSFVAFSFDPAASTVQSVQNAKCYQYKLSVADRVGNITEYAPANIVRVDGTAPNGAFATTQSLFGDTTTLTGSAFDAHSGLALVGLTYSKVGGGASGTVTGCTGLDLWTCTWDTSAVPEGSYIITLNVLDNASNAASFVKTIELDHTAPQVTNFTTNNNSQYVVARSAGACYSPITAQARSFRLGLDATDANGIASVNFPALTGLGTGATSGAAIRTTPTSGTYNSNVYTFGTAADIDNTNVIVRDAAGNETVVATQFVADSIAPESPDLTGGNATYVSQPSETITAALGDAGAGCADNQVIDWQSSLNGAAYADQGAGLTKTYSDEGETLVRARTMDAVGNTNGYVNSDEPVRLDRTSPTLAALTGDTSGAWRNTAANLTATTTNPGAVNKAPLSFSYTRTGAGAGTGNYAVGTSVLTHTLSDQGTSNWTINACDTAGNCATPRTATTKIDSIAPAEPTTSGGNAAFASVPSVATAGTFTQTPGDVSSDAIRYQAEATTYTLVIHTPPTNGGSYSPNQNGVTTVDYQVFDAAGNESAWTATPNPARIDRVAPSLSVTGDTSGAWRNTAASLNTASTDQGGSIGSGLDSAALTYTRTGAGATTGTYTVGTGSLTHALANQGTSSWTVRACDKAGNCATPVAVTTKVDNVAPTVPTVGQSCAVNWQNCTPSITFSGSTDATSGVARYERVTTAGVTVTSPLTDSTDGQEGFNIRACDAAENCSATAGVITKRDTVIPAVSVAGSCAVGVWQNCNPVLTRSQSDATSGIASTSGFANGTTDVTDGGETWTAGACDAAGNCNSASLATYRDTVAPAMGSSIGCVGGSRSGNICESVNATYYVNWSDATSGVASCVGTGNGAQFGSGGSTSTTCYDVAGNAASTSQSWNVVRYSAGSVSCTALANATGSCTVTGPNASELYGAGSVAVTVTNTTTGWSGSITNAHTSTFSLANVLCANGVAGANNLRVSFNVGPFTTTGSFQLSKAAYCAGTHARADTNINSWFG